MKVIDIVGIWVLFLCICIGSCAISDGNESMDSNSMPIRTQAAKPPEQDSLLYPMQQEKKSGKLSEDGLFWE